MPTPPTQPLPSFEHSPAVAEVLLRGASSPAGMSAAFIALGSRGWLAVDETADGLPRLRLTRPAGSSELSLPETERWLYGALGAWAGDPSRTPRTDGWFDAVGRQAAAEGALDAPTWRVLRRRAFFPALARRALPAAKAAAARAFAASLASFPSADGPVPRSRPEWDAAFAFAAALGQGQGFLARAREVNEYYARHFQGVVITFFTPAWHHPFMRDGLDRFAYLTTDLPQLLSGPPWRRTRPA